MQKGFARPLLVIVVLLLLSLPIIARSGFIQSKLQKTEVKGTQVETDKKYPNIKIISSSGSWELIRYGCKTEDECKRSAESGKKISSIGGGVTEGHQTNLYKDSTWDEYSYLKFQVKSGLGSSSRNFKVLNLESSSEAERKTFSSSDVLILPVNMLDTSVSTIAVFTDQ